MARSSWDTQLSEQTRSSLEDDEEFNEANESNANKVISQMEGANQFTINLGNGLQEAVIRNNLPMVQLTPLDLDHGAYPSKKKQMLRKAIINHRSWY